MQRWNCFLAWAFVSPICSESTASMGDGFVSESLGQLLSGASF